MLQDIFGSFNNFLQPFNKIYKLALVWFRCTHHIWLWYFCSSMNDIQLKWEVERERKEEEKLVKKKCIDLDTYMTLLITCRKEFNLLMIGSTISTKHLSSLSLALANTLPRVSQPSRRWSVMRWTISAGRMLWEQPLMFVDLLFLFILSCFIMT